MTKNEIWNTSNLTKREKVVLTYNTPAPLRDAQILFWETEENGKSAEDIYEQSVRAWEVAGRPTSEEGVQF